MAATVDLMGLVLKKEHAEGKDFEAEVDRNFHIAYGPELAKPLPPKPWLCEELRIAPGAVTIVGGAGFGGKTLALQAFALAVASGKKLWGQYDVRQGKVLHLDYEQDDLTVWRYQRLARDMGIDIAELGNLLGASLLPDAFLDDDGGERALAYLLTGAAVCIIDAFRGAFPRAEENDSGVRKWLDLLHRVSKKTGCTIIVIAHSRKMSADVDVKSSLRGSGALFDAAATVYMLDGTPGKPTQVHNTKERHTGKPRKKFGLRFVDVTGPGKEAGELDDEWGLRVEYVCPEDLQVAYDTDDGDDNSFAIGAERVASLGMRILHAITCSDDGLGIAMIRSMTGASGLATNAALEQLEKSGAITREGKGHALTFFAVPEREAGID